MAHQIGNILPKLTVVTTSPKPLTKRLMLSEIQALPGTLTEAQFLTLQEQADAPLPALPPCDAEFFALTIRKMRAALPMQNLDPEASQMFLVTLARKLGHYPQEAITAMASQVIDEFEWFPRVSQCLAILKNWQRNDDAAKAKALAGSIVSGIVTHRRVKAQAAHEAAIHRLQRGLATQEELDAMPESVKQTADTLGLIERTESGWKLRERIAA